QALPADLGLAVLPGMPARLPRPCADGRQPDLRPDVPADRRGRLGCHGRDLHRIQLRRLVSATLGRAPRIFTTMRWYWVRRALALAGILAFGVVGGSQLWIRGAAAGNVYAEADVPKRPVALVLGAMVHPDGTLSAFVEARVAEAKRLYDAGK